MGFNDGLEEIPRKAMMLFFIIDTSGSMGGDRIGALNVAIPETMGVLKEISENNADALIKVAALDFSSGCEWMYDEPKDASDFIWQDRTASNLTDMGAAFKELSSKLTTKEFMNYPSGLYNPVLILLSDGEPTDDYLGGLGKLKENKWYKAAIKVAIAIGNDANEDVLKEFTGNIEAVLKSENVDSLKEIIRIVSVTSATIASASVNTDDNASKEDAAVAGITEGIKDVDGASSSEVDAGDFEDEGW